MMKKNFTNRYKLATYNALMMEKNFTNIYKLAIYNVLMRSSGNVLFCSIWGGALMVLLSSQRYKT